MPAVEDLRWYHTLDLPGGIVTPGEYDLRPIVRRLPWPDSLAGMRCLDVGSRDGFYAFEMERRGAAEVVSLDVDDPAAYHLPHPAPVGGNPAAEVEAGKRAFEAAHSALDSTVQRVYRSVYDLDPAEEGQFDLVVIGTLLLHLRDPIRALQAVRSCTRGHLIVNDVIAAGAISLHRRPMAELLMQNGPFWWVANPPGLQRMVEAAGFSVLQRSRPYVVPWGAGGHRVTLRRALSRPVTDIPRRLVHRRGAPHVWLLAEPT
jgi:tRNA (mo5U34)-methyltransferase